MFRVGLRKKLDPTLITNPANVFAYNNQDPTLVINDHIFMVS